MALSHTLQCLRLFHCIIYWDNPCMDWEQLFVLGPELHLLVGVEVILCSSSPSQSQSRRQCRRSLFCTSAAVWKAHCSLSCTRFKISCFSTVPDFFSVFGSLFGFFYGLCWPDRVLLTEQAAESFGPHSAFFTDCLKVHHNQNILLN